MPKIRCRSQQFSRSRWKRAKTGPLDKVYGSGTDAGRGASILVDWSCGIAVLKNDHTYARNADGNRKCAPPPVPVSQFSDVPITAEEMESELQICYPELEILSRATTAILTSETCSSASAMFTLLSLTGGAPSDTCSHTNVCALNERGADHCTSHPKVRLEVLPTDHFFKPGITSDLETENRKSTPGLDTEDMSQLFSECIPILNCKLPHLWSSVLGDGGIHIMKYTAGVARIVQRSLFVSNTCNLIACFHGKELPAHHKYYDIAKQFSLMTRSAHHLAFALSQIVAEYRLFEVCAGSPNVKYRSLWHKEPACYVDVNPFHETRYIETCRSKACSYALPQLQRQCSECYKVFRRFSTREAFKKQADSVTTTHTKDPDKFKLS